MTMLEARSELDRLMGGDRMAKPSRSGPMWDEWNSRPARDRKRLEHFMSPSAAMTPDQLATDLDCSIDVALRTWRQACFIALDGLSSKPFSDDYAPAIADEDREPWGYAEIAEALGVQQRTVHQWIARANNGRLKFPGHDLIVHGLPTWWNTTVLDWAEETGRLAASGPTMRNGRVRPAIASRLESDAVRNTRMLDVPRLSWGSQGSRLVRRRTDSDTQIELRSGGI